MTELTSLALEAAACTRCRELAETRTQVVFGAGSPESDLMLVGEAPGATEDELGAPFAGASGRVLNELLALIGLERDDVYVTNVLLCRPPGNRDPETAEIDACARFLYAQASIVRPRVVATLGGFATKLLSGQPGGISRVHGLEQEIKLGRRPALLYPLYHPALALYAPSMRGVLERDFRRIPELLEREFEEEPTETAAPEDEQLQLVSEARSVFTEAP